MPSIKLVAIILLLSLIPMNQIELPSENTTIKVAVYNYPDEFNKRQVLMALRYTWKNNNEIFSFSYDLVNLSDVLKGKLKKFDVLIIASSAKSYLVDGQNKKWKEEIRKFVRNGGGFLGICGGAIAASRGFKDNFTAFHRLVNRGVLRIADVYVNDDLLQEWQYLFRIGRPSLSKPDDLKGPFSAFPSLNTTVLPSSIIPVSGFRCFGWAGGPGMYAISGNVKPLLIYNEEPMQTKPINFWLFWNGEWIKLRKIKTDIKNSLAAVSTTYGKGRVVIYGVHPEYPFVFKNGTIKEHIGRMIPMGPKQMVYNYIGYLHNFSYNIWIVRRSIAWAAGLDEKELPPCDETSVWILDPDPCGAIYILGKVKKLYGKIGTPSLIFGKPSLRFLTSRNAKMIEIYLDGEILNVNVSLMEEGYADLYMAKLPEICNGFHILKVRVYDEKGNFAEGITSFYLIKDHNESSCNEQNNYSENDKFH